MNLAVIAGVILAVLIAIIVYVQYGDQFLPPDMAMKKGLWLPEVPLKGVIKAPVETILPDLYGGKGGSEMEIRCPTGYMSGIKGVAGANTIHQVAPVCMPAGQLGTRVAGNRADGTKYDYQDPMGLSYIDVHHDDNSVIGLTASGIGPLAGKKHFGKTSQKVGRIQCPKGSTLVGLKARAGDWVDALGGICSTQSLRR